LAQTILILLPLIIGFTVVNEKTRRVLEIPLSNIILLAVMSLLVDIVEDYWPKRANSPVFLEIAPKASTLRPLS